MRKSTSETGSDKFELGIDKSDKADKTGFLIFGFTEFKNTGGNDRAIECHRINRIPVRIR